MWSFIYGRGNTGLQEANARLRKVMLGLEEVKQRLEKIMLGLEEVNLGLEEVTQA